MEMRGLTQISYIYSVQASSILFGTPRVAVRAWCSHSSGMWWGGRKRGRVNESARACRMGFGPCARPSRQAQ